MTTKISALKRAVEVFKKEMGANRHGIHDKPNLRGLELGLQGIALGIFIGFSISEHQSFMENWGWAVAWSIWLAGCIVGAIRDRRLRKTLSYENHAA